MPRTREASRVGLDQLRRSVDRAGEGARGKQKSQAVLMGIANGVVSAKGLAISTDSYQTGEPERRANLKKRQYFSGKVLNAIPPPSIVDANRVTEAQEKLPDDKLADQ